MQERGINQNGQFVMPVKKEKKSLDAIVASVVVGFFLLSVLSFSKITGNVIGNSTISNMIGVVFLLVGLVAAFFYFRKRR